MHEADVADWLSSCTVRDARALLEGAERSYRHPYGFIVHRSALLELAPWNLRVHVWPSPLDCYEMLRRNGTEPQLIHAHGWDLLSVVMDGELEERAYELRIDHDGDYVRYSTSAKPGQKASLLHLSGEKLVMDAVEKRVRRYDMGAYSIPAGTYHSTLPAAQSISLVATRQFPGQVSEVAAFRTVRDHIENPSPSPSVDISLLEGEGDHVWSSFVFFVDAGRALLLRTTARPHQWHPVGGRRAAGDASPVDTLMREVYEEVGARLDPTMVKWMGARRADEGDGVVCFWKAEGDILSQSLEFPRDEIEETRWWDLAEVASLPMYGASVDALQGLLNSSGPSRSER
ncbi:NUDIX domain-containing protein [Catenuloplanes niger]|uniref:8-oxo-dGTP pyrophosphatase MutT (NUDIX family) n=2 Tax=Micromonosporaceae TaxID=28056 RepID=A0AAE4CSN5_9ACTN|nr:8-oxo-dGTP pyrophosphatase MutT (NUDIX family) [Catenuloplanes niger]